jgi:hypothetical protein
MPIRQIPFVVLFRRFAELWKATISLVTSVWNSVCPSVHIEQLGSHWTDFKYILYLSIFRKYVENIQVSLKFYKNNGYFTWITIYIFDLISPISS